MTNERLTEAQRRDLAHAHMGEVEEDAHRVVAKDLKQMISLRLDSTLAGCLREMALEQGTSVSDLLRDAALRIVEEHQSRQVSVAVTYVRALKGQALTNASISYWDEASNRRFGAVSPSASTTSEVVIAG